MALSVGCRVVAIQPKNLRQWCDVFWANKSVSWEAGGIIRYLTAVDRLRVVSVSKAARVALHTAVV